MSSKAVLAAGLSFNSSETHSVVYDVDRTADLFCTVANRWRQLELLEREHSGLAPSRDTWSCSGSAH